MIINHNLMANNANRNIGINSTNASKSMSKLASGLRINGAADDAAGLAISEKMRGQINGLEKASSNAQDGISLVQTAEGALNETTSIVQRMRELAVQSSNGTVTDDDRKALQNEVSQLKDEIDRIGNTTQFNTMNLLDGSLKSAGGAVVGQNTTDSAIVAKLTATRITADKKIESNKPATADFVKETLTIDGTSIDVNWQNLTSDEKNTLSGTTSDPASRNASAKLIVDKINEAIDQSGKNVAHVTGYVDSTTGKLVLESGSKGADSSIKAGTAGVVKKEMGTLVTTTGKTTYNGSSIAANTTFDFKIGDISLQGEVDKLISNTTTMGSAALVLQSAINKRIGSYNSLQNKVSGQDGFIQTVKVNATKDGRFEVVSESGPIKFSDPNGQTAVESLGLTDAQTSASGNGGMTFQIGANKGQTMQFGIGDMRTAALGLSSLDISTKGGAQNAITALDAATKLVSSERSKLGAVQNRLEHTINNLGTASQNLTTAESRIRDTDMASEMATYSKFNIESQAAQAMLAQANQQPQQVLQLLR